tara:strand:+ start:7697 stop:8167 length:471 start_codon:yes stop_codon:yes gene_type:complete
MIKKSAISLIIVSFLITACGFKVVNKNYPLKFDIVNIETLGENRINFLLRKSLKNRNNDSKNQINLKIETLKEKSIKEKNIKNEITKYEIKITANISYQITPNIKKGKFSVSEGGSFDVNKKYSQTIKNEKNLIKSLTENLASEINNNLINITDDF